MSKEEAEIAIRGIGNRFLVRQSSNDLFLTSKRRGWIYHHLIKYSTEGYCLEWKEKRFKTIPEMILHYLTFPIDTGSTQILGIGCDREGKINNLTITQCLMEESTIWSRHQLYAQFLAHYSHIIM